MVEIETLKGIFRRYKKEDIIITKHAEIQAYIREIDLEEVKENITNPEKLVYAEEQSHEKQGGKKYNCYFAYSNNLYHRYILTMNGKIIIVTIIKINRKWQRIVER